MYQVKIIPRFTSICCWLFLTAAMVAISCKTQTPATTKEHADEQGNLIFITLKIKKDTDGKESVQLVDKIWSKGTLKKQIAQKPHGVHVLTCKFLNQDSEEIQRMVVSNPLYAQMESYSPDGTIQRNQLDLTEAPFMIRTEITKDVYYLVIEDHSNKELGKFTLK